MSEPGLRRLLLWLAAAIRHGAYAEESGGRGWMRSDLNTFKDSMRGVHIKFGVPPVNYEPLWTFETDTSAAAAAGGGGDSEAGSGAADQPGRRLQAISGKWAGFMVELLDRLSLTLGFTYTMIAAPPYNPDNDGDGQRSRMLLGSGMVDFLFTVSSNGVMEQDTRIFQTAPVHNSYYSGIVLKTSKSVSLFRFAEPFTPTVWGSMLAVVIGTSLLLSLLDLIWPPDSGSIGKNRMCDGKNDLKEQLYAFVTGAYHITAAMLGGEDYEWLTWPLKILRTGLLFLVLIVQATYTANLAAFLSAPSIEIHGPTTMDGLAESVVCVLHPDFSSPAFQYGGSVVMASLDELPQLASGTIDIDGRKDWVRDQLDTGGCDIWMHDVAVLQGEYLASCANRELASWINVAPIIYAMGGFNRSLVANLSAGIASFSQMPEFASLQRSHFGTGLTCGAESGGSDQPITVDMMAGMYIIYAALAGVAVLVAVANRLKATFSKETVETDLDHTATEGEMLRALLRKMDHLLEKEGLDEAAKGKGDSNRAA